MGASAYVIVALVFWLPLTEVVNAQTAASDSSTSPHGRKLLRLSVCDDSEPGRFASRSRCYPAPEANRLTQQKAPNPPAILAP
ncbi:hypothetical protein Nepgr_009659 [Nepenthes gracilis]|uniref:Secreted protein n=1 Tax=Nepenthes gracilis TaxID=150966 RepID=A0AAD3SBT6_NEPGR|nr:hypothetical protein Nepgr_009659 [Nepenthes gracilis]